MKKILLLTAILCLLATGARAETFLLPLHKLAPVSTVKLQCTLGQYDISVPVPERWKVNAAVLTLDYVNSTSLLSERSNLVVTVNDQTVGQVKLDRRAPAGRLKLAVPAALLASGYNTLNIKAVQHYAAECEQVCAPNLWTTVNLYDSSLQLDYELRPVPLELSAVAGFLFDPKIMPSAAVHVVTGGLTSDTATMAGIVASGIARKYDYRKVVFTISHDLLAGKDNILIGDKKFVEDFLRRIGITVNVTGPYLKILPLPGGEGADPAHALLVVSGAGAGEIKLAAETLAHMSLPYPGSDEAIVKDFKLPDISLYSGRQVLTADKEYTLGTLNFETHTFAGFNPNPRHIAFRLPADFLVRPNQYAKLNLNFSYGAGMRNDSVLNVVVNDRSVRVIHLKNPDGESIEGYRIDLPTYLFKPGYNTVRFEATLNPVARECDVLRQEGFFLTIFENSTFFFPAMPHFVEMPKLELFMLDGFPVTRWPDGYESVVYVTRNDADTTAAALNVIGLISQKNGYPLFGTKISYEKPVRWKGEMIVIGDAASVPEDILNLAPMKLASTKTVPYPVIRDWEREATFAYSGQKSSLGPDSGVVMEFQSPYAIGRSILLFTAAGVRDLSSLSTALLETGVQDKVKGDLVLVDLKDPATRTLALTAGPAYFTGKKGTFFRLEYYFYKYTYLNYLLMTLGILIAGGLAYYFLRRRKRLRAQGGDAAKGH